MGLSRRRLLHAAAVVIAATASDVMLTGGAPAPLSRAAPGPEGFTPTSRVDPRAYLGAGQTWTTVACIRPALQAALDEAHRRTLHDPSAVVEVVIPPGIGRLTTRSRRAPLNRSSRTDPPGIYDTRIGLGLRANIAGRIVIRGSGGWGRKSVIRLSDAARNLFWIDTDTGVDWKPTAAHEPSGIPVSRPAQPLLLRNILFQGFGVDNGFSKGSGHIVCGNVPGFTTPQRYVGMQNVHAIDIDVWGVAQPANAEAQRQSSKAPFVYIARHFSDYEANGGPGAGTVAGHTWKGWNLKTASGRMAAHLAGWTWMSTLSFERVRGTNTNRGIIVVGEPTRAFSHFVDDVVLRGCEHLQDHPYTTSTIQQTSFFIGGSCQGGSTSILSCRSVNVGDDSVEIGGMQSVHISDLTSVNACLAGIYLRYAQPPLNWRTTRVVVEDSTFSVTGDAIRPKQSFPLRAVPIDAKFEGDAAPYALNDVEISRCNARIDGRDASGAQVGVLDSMSRRQRYGWFLTGPIVNATYTSCTAVVTRVRLASVNPERFYRIVMWHAQQSVPAGLGATPKLVINDCIARAGHITTSGGTAEFVGLAAHSSGTVVVDGFSTALIDSGTVFRSADIARIGWVLPSEPARAGVSQRISDVSGTMTGSNVRYRKPVTVYDDQRVGSSRVSGVGYQAWGSTVAVDTSHGPDNAKRLTVG